MHGKNDNCEIETGNADKIIIEQILDIDFVTRRGGKFKIWYRRDDGDLHCVDYGKIDLNYADYEEKPPKPEMLKELEKDYEENVHPKYENVKFDVKQVDGGYKISWHDNASDSLDYDHHEIWLDDSYPFDPDSPNFQKIYIRSDVDNYLILQQDKPLKAVKVQAVYY